MLNSYEESATLPHGYSMMLIISNVPSLWFKICNPIVEAANSNSKVKKEILDEL